MLLFVSLRQRSKFCFALDLTVSDSKW